MTTELWGVYEAEVVDVADPARHGRVALRIPSAGQAAPVWAVPSVATPSTPDVGARVWVQFAGGDGSRPVYLASIVSDAALADILHRIDALELG